MAVSNEDLARLIVTLEVSTTRLYNGLRKAQQQTNTTANNIQRRLEGMASSLDRTFANLGQRLSSNLTGPLAGIGAAFSVREIVRYADVWTEAGNRIRAAGEIVGLQGRPLEQIRQLADEGRAGFNETVQLYSRLLRSAGNVATSELEVAKATDIVNKAFKAGGAATSEMNAGILQLSQGLSSGFLQGDELRSVRENAPVLAQVIADYFGVSIGKLKELGAEGELTSEKVFKAILSGQKQVEAAFVTTNRTIGDSFKLVENALIQYIGNADRANGATSIITQALTALADNFSAVADVALKLAAILAGAILGRSILAMVGSVKSSIAIFNVFNDALRTTGSTASAVSKAFGKIGLGPLSILIGGTAALAFQHFSSEAAAASERIRETNALLDEMGLTASRIAGTDLKDATNQLLSLAAANNKFAAAEDARQKARLRQEINDLDSGNIGTLFGSLFKTNKELESLQDLLLRARDGVYNLFSSKQTRDFYSEFARLISLFKEGTIDLNSLSTSLQNIVSTKGAEQDIVDFASRFFDIATDIERRRVLLRIKADTTEIDIASEDIRNFYRILEQNPGFGNDLKNDIVEVTSRFDGTKESADEVRSRLVALSKTNPDLGNWLTQLSQLTNSFNLLATAIETAKDEADKFLKDANFDKTLRRQANDYLRQLNNQSIGAKALNDYLAEQNRLLGLTESQLKLEQEVKKVRKEASEAGATLTKDQELKLARRRIALAEQYKADRKESDAAKFLKNFSEKEDELDLLREEIDFRKTLNPLLGDYTRRLDEFKIKQEFLNEAKKAGVIIDTDINDRLEDYATLKAALNEEDRKLIESQEKLRDTTQEWLDLARNSTRSIIDDLIEGKSAAEAFGGALQQIGSFLIDLGLNSIFGKIGGDTGIGSLFSGLGKRERGGPVSAGRPYIVGEKRPEVFVPNENGVIIPRVPNSLSASGGTSVPISISIDATGADAAGLARLQAEVLRLRTEIPSMVRQVTQNRIKKGW